MMKEIKIYFSEDSDLIDEYIKPKGWRDDIIVEFENKYYRFQFIIPYNIEECFLFAEENNQAYCIDMPTIIANDIKKDTIIKKILLLKLSDFKFFSPINLEEEFSNNFQKLCDIKNWVRVY